MTTDTNNVLPLGQGFDDWVSLFVVFRVDSLPGGRVLTGRLRPGLAPDTAELASRLAEWSGSYAARSGPNGYDLLLFLPAARRERWWLHLVLFLVTLGSTVVAGALLAGRQPVAFAALPLLDGWWLPLPIALELGALKAGLPFGLTLVAILALHESGHYFAARHHSISVTPPYFIPFPPYFSVIGTLGAFIRLRSPVLNRGALLDVGVAGPLLSFAASLPPLLWGLMHSRVVAVPPGLPSDYLVRFASEQLWLGGSIAFSAMARVVIGPLGSGEILALHPVAFAGWIGLFVTALNLLPISQLDGGHILYALLGRRQTLLAWPFFAALIPLGFLWPGWWVWAVLVFAIGRGRVRHPPVFDEKRDLSGARVVWGLATAVILLVCFVPVPFRL